MRWLAAHRIAWIEHRPEEPEVEFGWILLQPPKTAQQRLTFKVASAVNGFTGTDAGRPVNDGLARALGLDMTRWWSATGEAYLQRVSKARVARRSTPTIPLGPRRPPAPERRAGPDRAGSGDRDRRVTVGREAPRHGLAGLALAGARRPAGARRTAPV